ncbi:DUF4397 domain-containing protein [Salipaludibacillus sp. LMS25]|uniref:DUF4397 domain-containing protein n=1 Tax=Salipaludibacillus sp. LMS25 TaxID=2924031 RepID=UPI0020D1321A|nr:DUF4397 domain-containing protein [Salipaludibacillus sp. LMS25]UTR14227.1 DUF4397 domain-containing protein [Salipaludibacillus sp. LMS25]
MKKRKVLARVVTLLFIFFTVSRFVLADTNDGKIRFVHTSPDTPQIDVAINDEVVVEGLEYTKASDYIVIPPNEYTLTIYPSGDYETPLLNTTITIDEDRAYTAAIVHMVENLDVNVMEDTTRATDGMAIIRAANLSPDAPTVSLVVNDVTLFSALPYMNISEYTELASGTTRLNFFSTEEHKALLSLPIELDHDIHYTVFLVGLTNGAPELDAVILADPSLNRLPSQLPVTGLGGASAYKDNGITIGGILSILITLTFIFLLFQLQPWDNHSDRES